jgi:hypothetical protein
MKSTVLGFVIAYWTDYARQNSFDQEASTAAKDGQNEIPG